MKIAYKNNKTDKWKTVSKVRNMSINDKFIILTMIDGNVNVLKREDVKYIRETKLYEGVEL